jgi:hypothetical protein
LLAEEKIRRSLAERVPLRERERCDEYSTQNARKFARVACHYLRIIAHAQSVAVHPSAASSFPVLAFSGRTLVLSLPSSARPPRATAAASATAKLQ